MRILFLTNFYPPAARGGYEFWCQEVALGLREGGHRVGILTSRYNRQQIDEPDPDWVQRELHLEMEIASLRNSLLFFTSRNRREDENLALLRDAISSSNPDRMLIWGMWNLPRSLPALAEQLMPGRVVYYMGDYWPTLPSQFENYWQSMPRSRIARLPKRLLGFAAERILDREARPPLQFEHVLYPSAFMRDEFARRGIKAHHSTIIYGGVDTSLYRQNSRNRTAPDSQITRLLFTGRLTPDKGVHTALEAVSKLVHEFKTHSIKLSIVGTGEQDYEAKLNDIVQQEKIEPFVTFLGAKAKAEMPAIYRQADIFLFTSTWPEPFGRVLIEAMSSELAVIGTAVGGAAEILVKNENALLFPPGDSDALAGQILKLIESPALRVRLAQNGLHQAVDSFDIHKMVRGIETYLLSALP